MLVPIQWYYLDTFKVLAGRSKTEQAHALKKNNFAIGFGFTCWIYGPITFIFMLFGPKNTVIWGLIAAYTIGLVSFFITIWKERKNLKAITQSFCEK